MPCLCPFAKSSENAINSARVRFAHNQREAGVRIGLVFGA